MYPDMCDLLEEQVIGDYALEYFTITEVDFYAKKIGLKPGDYVRLVNKKTHALLMSNTNMEKRTNEDFVECAKGDVLIGGLGIGLIILAIQDKPEVTSITVIEKSPEVIELITSQIKFNKKVKVINDDVFSWIPKTKYDVAYMDIWSYINSDVYYNEMVPLMDKFREALYSPRFGFNRCWAEYEAENNMRLI